MKKTKLLSLIAIILTLIFFSKNYFSKNTSLTEKERYRKFMAEHPFKKHRTEYSNKENEKENKTDRPDLAWEQDFLMTLDPALGYPPTERLQTAYEVAKQRTASRNAIPGLDWDERGPNNVGGRTRAIMFDPNDGTNKKVWAGGVTGGLWYNNDITSAASSWNKVDDFWNSIAISCIAYDPNNTQIFYVGTGESFTADGSYPGSSSRGNGIWKTTDGGATWAQLSTTTGYYYVSDIIVRNESGASVVYAGVNQRFWQGQWHGSADGLYRSTNGGTSWTEVMPTISGSNYAPADIELAADNRIWIGTTSNGFGDGGGTVLYSDNGTTWTAITDYQSVTGVGRVELACAPSNSNIVYGLVEADNIVFDVVATTDKGVNWSSMAFPSDADGGVDQDGFTRGQAWYDLILAVDPNNANTVFAGGIDLFKSTDGANSWTQISHWYGGFGFPEVHADQHAIVFQPGSSSAALFGNDGGIYRTANATSSTPSFSSRNNGYNITQFYACAMNPNSGSNNFLAGAQDNGTQKFTTSGVNSTTEATSGDGAFCFIDQDNAAYQIASYVGNTFYLSTNSGGSFFTSLYSDGNTGRFINPAAYDDRENILFSGYSTSQILRIKNITGSFTSSQVTITGMGGEVSHIAVSPYSTSGTSTIFIGTENGDLFKVTNAHSTPSVTNISGASFPSGNISSVEIGSSESELLVTFSNYGVTSVWYSSNGGSSWVSKEGNLPDMPVRWALFNPADRTQVILATEVGIWSTTNVSVSLPDWDPSNTGMGNVRVDMLKYRSSDKMIIAATHGRGLFSSDVFASPPPPPVANFKSNDSSVCVGTSVTFTDLSTNSPSSWTWTFSGGTPSSSTSQNPSVAYNTAGTYNVSLTATNGGGSDAETKTGFITVFAKPSVSATTASFTICAGISTTLTASGGSTYTWSPSTGLSATTGSSVTATPSSTITYIATGTNANGCTDTGKVTITVNPKPNATMTSVNDVNCFGGNDGTATCTVTSGSGGNIFVWSSGQSSATVTNFSQGNYSVTVTDSQSCKDTATVSIAQPTSPISLTTDSTDDTGTNNGTATVTPTGGTPNYFYSWNSTPVQTTATATNLPTGTYKVVVTDANGCKDSVSVTVKLNTGLRDNISIGNINLSPNPFVNRIEVQLDFIKSQNITITVQNVEGKIILSEKLTGIKNEKHTLNLENNADGIYFVKIKTDENVFVRKIILAK